MTAHTPVPLAEERPNAGDRHSLNRSSAAHSPPAPGHPCPQPQSAPTCISPPQEAAPSPPRPGSPSLPLPALWLRKERKNRKQNFLAADGHQLHILQMPPSKNKPAATPPDRLTPGAPLSPLSRELQDCGSVCPGPPIPAHPSKPRSPTLRQTALDASFTVKLDPSVPVAQPSPLNCPLCFYKLLSSLSSTSCRFQPCALGFRDPPLQTRSPQVFLTAHLESWAPPDPPLPLERTPHPDAPELTAPPATGPVCPASQVPGRNFSLGTHSSHNSPELFPRPRRASADRRAV